jgi:hypothetical protein
MGAVARGWCKSAHCGGAAVVKLRDLEFAPLQLLIRRPWRHFHDRHRQWLASSAARPLLGTVAILSGQPGSVYQRLPALSLDVARLLQLQHDHCRQWHNDEHTYCDEVDHLTGTILLYRALSRTHESTAINRY